MSTGMQSEQQQQQQHQVWSPSRKELEMAIQAEKAKDHEDWNPDLQSEEQRLTKRLGKLNLEMKVMVGDGNCQVCLSPESALLQKLIYSSEEIACYEAFVPPALGSNSLG